MAGYITTLEKHKFVCGLFWQSLSKPRELNREAAELGRRIDSDLMVVRMDHTTAQAGFAQTRDGIKRGMYSLAAVVSKTLAIEGAFYDGEQQPVHNWLGAFKLPDGHWVYFAVRDANFLPNGDFAGTKEEVLDRLHNDYALGGWNVVLGEDELRSFGFHNFQPRDIKSFIPQRPDGSIRIHKWWGMRQIGGRPSWVPMAAAAAVIGAVALGGTYGWKIYQQKKEEREREIAMQQVRERLMREASVAARPWAKKASPVSLMQSCQKQFTHPTAGGWVLESYTCTQEAQTYAWGRGMSTVAMLREQMPDAVVEATGERASYARPLKLQAPQNEDLKDTRETLEPLLSRLQMMGVPIKVSTAPTPQLNTSDQQWQPNWRSYLFKLVAGGMEPLEIAEILNRPGVRVDKVVYQGSQWIMEGTIYAK
ncbi:type 4b pilus protein PilO2 [Herbaspirillum chlorophenolicum]|uniref:type 4b pilus protein PilO2 n=1 Tax=Herbaspirillum chlorophenolicum TaxID=211589 RepID=UPI00067BDC1F|nr:type 4b pilus protein PilO2 [Herbaspirillum chlorophenolicum]